MFVSCSEARNRIFDGMSRMEKDNKTVVIPEMTVVAVAGAENSH